MRRITLMTVMCAVAMAVVTAQSQAEVLLNNLGGTYMLGSSIYGPNNYDNVKAAGFLMGDNSFLLDSVELYLENMETSNVPVVSLFDNGVGDEPDNLLVTLNNPAFNYGDTGDTYAFTPTANFELAANTDYWIVVSNAALDSDGFEWQKNLDNSLPIGPMATSTGYLYREGSNPWGSSVFHNAYAVNGRIIPEPATGALLALGLAGLAGRRSRQALHIISGCRKQALGGG